MKKGYLKSTWLTHLSPGEAQIQLDGTIDFIAGGPGVSKEIKVEKAYNWCEIH